MPQDVTPSTYADASQEELQAFLKQQSAVASRAKRLASQDKSVEYQSLGDLRKQREFERDEANRATRMRTVLNRRARD